MSSATAASNASASYSTSVRSCGVTDSGIAAASNQIEGDVDEHVLLATHHAAAAGFLEESSSIDVRIGRRPPRLPSAPEY